MHSNMEDERRTGLEFGQNHLLFEARARVSEHIPVLPTDERMKHLWKDSEPSVWKVLCLQAASTREMPSARHVRFVWTNWSGAMWYYPKLKPQK
mmetsp:Transcript_21390/g.31849  ORF Transcript_21390/g.31849 Transcript_21390/m.31849 type:complete len:94 (-) Transcript_21390:17-298(-)